ncbi:MAG: radical SAM protein [Candidatus Eremiobacteraeota bacterium]|nr:radical SAM protein [Candidatus Eremiobacteraeota bacterium]
MIGLAYCDQRGRIFYDAKREPLADGGIVAPAGLDDLLPAPLGTMQMTLPGRTPLVRDKRPARGVVLAAVLPSGYTRLLVPAFRRAAGAPELPLYGYTFACVIDDELHVAARKTDEREDWKPRYFAQAELETAIGARMRVDGDNRVLRQVALCSRDYGCFTAQNVFFCKGEAALPVSPKCNAKCVGCISQLEPEANVPSPQRRIVMEASPEELARVGVYHLQRVQDGIVSFGQGCEGEPLLRVNTVARAIEAIRRECDSGTVNLNTNGSLPRALQRCIDAGLQAVRVSLNSFRPQIYSAYYRPTGYALEDVFESIRLAGAAGLRVSLNLLTHPGVTDDEAELLAMNAFLEAVRVDMIQTRTLNIDPERYFEVVGRPTRPLGMRHVLGRIAEFDVAIGNFTHAP